jgi:hypothetical protein
MTKAQRGANASDGKKEPWSLALVVNFTSRWVFPVELQ